MCLVLVLGSPLARQHGKNEITGMRLQLGLGSVHDPPLFEQRPGLGLPLCLVDSLLLARRHAIRLAIHTPGRTLLVRCRGNLLAPLPRLGLPHHLFLLLALQTVEHGGAALDIAQPLHSLCNGGGAGVAAADALFGQANALAAYFEALSSNLAHGDLDPAVGAQGGDGLCDLLDAGAEGADASGVAGIKRRTEGAGWGRGGCGGGGGGGGGGGSVRDISGGRGGRAHEVLEGVPGRGQIEEDDIGVGTGRVVAETEAVSVDITVGDGHERVQAVVFDLGPELVGARFVVFEAVDGALSAWALPARGGHANCIVRVGSRGLDAREAVKDGTDGSVGEAATAGAGFDDVVPRPGAQALKDVAVVGRVDDLGAVRQRQRPRLGRGRDEMGKAAAGGGCLDEGPLNDVCTRHIVISALGVAVLGIPLPLLGLAARARIDNRGEHLSAPRAADQGAVGKGAKARVLDLALCVVRVAVRGEQRGNQVVATQLQDAEAVCRGMRARVEEGREHGRHCEVTLPLGVGVDVDPLDLALVMAVAERISGRGGAGAGPAELSPLPLVRLSSLAPQGSSTTYHQPPPTILIQERTR